jgi:hypothetical protein
MRGNRKATVRDEGRTPRRCLRQTIENFSNSPSLRTAVGQIAVVALALFVSAPQPSFTQNPPPKSVVGTLSVYKLGAAEIEVKPDNAPAVALKLSEKTLALRVAPGEKDLKKAETIKTSDLAVGDRVLVTLEPGSNEVRRIVVMSATDIAKRNEADRQDWLRRGLSGIVAAKSGHEITLKMRSLQGPVQATVTVDERSSFKCYAPDSVKFADARASTVDDISVGDQLRARGQKSEDGLKVTAEEVVFGTFLMKAGTITSVNVEANEITVKELGNGKALLIRVTPDSQLKMMPNLGALMGGGGRPGFSPAGGSPSAGAPGANGGRPGGRGDLSQMLERMPAAKLDELKPGETVVVSSTKGARNDQITAIMLVANADLLIQMAQMQSGGMNGRGMNTGLMEGFGTFELPTMIP